MCTGTHNCDIVRSTGGHHDFPAGSPAENHDVLAPAKLGKGGRDVRSNSETFRWNPAGNQSRPVEWPTAGSESCVALGQPRLRSVDSECPGRVIEPRKINWSWEPSLWT